MSYSWVCTRRRCDSVRLCSHSQKISEILIINYINTRISLSHWDMVQSKCRKGSLLIGWAVVSSPGRKTWSLHAQLSGKALGSLKCSPGCSRTHVEYVMGMDNASGKLSPHSCSSESGEGANSGDGGDIPSPVLWRDTTWVGLLRVSVSLTLLSSLLVLLFSLESLLSTLTWFKSNVG